MSDIANVLIEYAKDKKIIQGEQLSFIPEISSAYTSAIDFFMDCYPKLQHKNRYSYINALSKYLFVKSVEGVILWGVAPKGEISVCFNVQDIDDENSYTTDLPPDLHNCIIGLSHIGEQLYRIYISYLEDENIYDEAKLYQHTKTFLMYVFNIGISYALDDNMQTLLIERSNEHTESASNSIISGIKKKLKNKESNKVQAASQDLLVKFNEIMEATFKKDDEVKEIESVSEVLEVMRQVVKATVDDLMFCAHKTGVNLHAIRSAFRYIYVKAVDNVLIYKQEKTSKVDYNTVYVFDDIINEKYGVSEYYDLCGKNHTSAVITGEIYFYTFLDLFNKNRNLILNNPDLFRLLLENGLMVIVSSAIKKGIAIVTM